MSSYDLAVIGSGPGGYLTGIYAARHNLKVCIIEKDVIGGTCLNRGCVPAKSLISSASLLSKIKNSQTYGISINGISVDFQKMMSRKDDVVLRLRTGVEGLLKANKIDTVIGKAVITGPNIVSVHGKGDIKAENIIIAAGSRVSGVDGIRIDDTDILSSDSILNIKSAPESMIIVGGGVIGCEFASLFNKLGTKITIVEMSERLIPGQSREASRRLEQYLRKSGINIITSSRVCSSEVCGMVRMSVSGGKTLEAKKVLVSAGRAANIDNLGLDAAGIKVSNGKIFTDEYLKTNIANIYAVGDCIAGPQLAHKASYDGMVACDNIMGKKRKADYRFIPTCIWTDPEIACVGVSEESAKEKSLNYKIAKFQMSACGKACIDGSTDGYVKLIGSDDGRVVGVEIIGSDACNLIGEAAVAVSSGISIADWSRVVHGHPTLSEIFQEAGHVFCGTPLHSA